MKKLTQQKLKKKTGFKMKPWNGLRTAKIQCCIKTHRKMKWRLAMRIASLPEERWAMKAAGWNPELSTKYKTYRAVGRPKNRWENEINDFFRPERTEDEENGK